MIAVYFLKIHKAPAIGGTSIDLEDDSHMRITHGTPAAATAGRVGPRQSKGRARPTADSAAATRRGLPVGIIARAAQDETSTMSGTGCDFGLARKLRLRAAALLLVPRRALDLGGRRRRRAGAAGARRAALLRPLRRSEAAGRSRRPRPSRPPPEGRGTGHDGTCVCGICETDFLWTPRPNMVYPKAYICIYILSIVYVLVYIF
jgi:hypothetical protein